MDNMIAADDVRTTCLNKETYDVTKFVPFIEAAEKKFIKPFLGDDLYAEIRTEYEEDGLSTLNQALVDLLKPALAWFTLHLAMPFIQMDITTSGIQINNSEYASSGTDKQRGDIMNATLDIAETFLGVAKEYLEPDTPNTNYPLYNPSDNISNNTNIIGGIIFDIDND